MALVTGTGPTLVITTLRPDSWFYILPWHFQLVYRSDRFWCAFLYLIDLGHKLLGLLWYFHYSPYRTFQKFLGRMCVYSFQHALIIGKICLGFGRLNDVHAGEDERGIHSALFAVFLTWGVFFFRWCSFKEILHRKVFHSVLLNSIVISLFFSLFQIPTVTQVYRHRVLFFWISIWTLIFWFCLKIYLYNLIILLCVVFTIDNKVVFD